MDHVHEVERAVVFWTQRFDRGDQCDPLPPAREDLGRLRPGSDGILSIPLIPDRCCRRVDVPGLAVEHLNPKRRCHGGCDRRDHAALPRADRTAVFAGPLHRVRDGGSSIVFGELPAAHILGQDPLQRVRDDDLIAVPGGHHALDKLVSLQLEVCSDKRPHGRGEMLEADRFGEVKKIHAAIAAVMTFLRAGFGGRTRLWLVGCFHGPMNWREGKRACESITPSPAPRRQA